MAEPPRLRQHRRPDGNIDPPGRGPGNQTATSSPTTTGGSSIEEERTAPTPNRRRTSKDCWKRTSTVWARRLGGRETVLAGGARGRQAATALKKAAQVCREAFARPKMGKKAEDDLSATAEALLDALLDLWQAEHDDALRDSIARCGEAWWAREQAPFAAPPGAPLHYWRDQHRRALPAGEVAVCHFRRCSRPSTSTTRRRRPRRPVGVDDVRRSCDRPGQGLAGRSVGNTASSAAHQSVKKALPSGCARARGRRRYKRAFDSL